MNAAAHRAKLAVVKEVRTHLGELLAKHRLSIDARGVAGWSIGHPDFEGDEKMTADRYVRDAILDFLSEMK